jgi:hypothetical protein
MVLYEVCQDIFSPDVHAFWACRKGHALVPGDRIVVAVPAHPDAAPATALACPACRGERPDVPPPPPGQLTLVVPADLFDELPPLHREVLHDVARRARPRTMRSFP